MPMVEVHSLLWLMRKTEHTTVGGLLSVMHYYINYWWHSKHPASVLNLHDLAKLNLFTSVIAVLRIVTKIST